MMNITIRMNASTNSVTVGDKVFDRSSMSREDRAQMTRMITRAFKRTSQQVSR